MRSFRSVGALAVAALFVVGACGSSTSSPSASGAASGRPTSGTSPTSSATSAGPTGSGTAGASASTGASSGPIANVPTDQLVFPGKLVICSDFPYPPQEFFDDQGNPIGSDVEIGNEI